MCVCVFVSCTLMCIYYVNSLYIHVCCVHLCFSMERPSTLGARYGHSLVYLFAMGSFTASGVDQLAETGLHSEIHGSPYLCLPYAGIVRLHAWFLHRCKDLISGPCACTQADVYQWNCYLLCSYTVYFRYTFS